MIFETWYFRFGGFAFFVLPIMTLAVIMKMLTSQRKNSLQSYKNKRIAVQKASSLANARSVMNALVCDTSSDCRPTENFFVFFPCIVSLQRSHFLCNEEETRNCTKLITVTINLESSSRTLLAGLNLENLYKIQRT